MKKHMGTANEPLKQDAAGIFRRPEGHILLAGIALLVGAVLWAGSSWFWSPEYGRKVIALALARLVVGRPGGVYFGHVQQFDYLTNIGVNLIVDVVAVFLIYPLFVLSIENIFAFHSLKSLIDRIHQTAQANYKNIKKYGVPGLFLFVLFPLWGTGPVVGCVIGYIMVLRPWFNMAIVLGATLLAIILWTVILAEFHVHLLAYSAYLPVVVIAVLFVSVIATHVVRALRRKN